MVDLEASLAAIRGAWMSGRSALEVCPEDWRAAFGEGLRGEPTLAAVVGHAAAIGLRPTPAEALTLRPLLPRLALPPVRDALRPRVRRVLAAQKGADETIGATLALLAARGYSAHPADWMPGGKETWAPELYAPWLDWANAEAAAGTPHTEISEASYEEWPFAERRRQLIELRRRDSAAALAIIAAKAGAEPAERRVRLIEILETSLSEADAPFLETLAGDRSDRVKALARNYRARLGLGVEAGALEVELAEMVEAKRSGFHGLRQPQFILIKGLKTAPQRARRSELFSLVSLAGLAEALGVKELALVEAAPEGDQQGVFEFVSMAALTGSDDARRALFEAILEDASANPMLLPPFGARMSEAERAEALPRVLGRDASETFDTTIAFGGGGAISFAEVENSPGFSAFLSLIDPAFVDPKRYIPPQIVALGLLRLGLLLDAQSARTLIGMLEVYGLSPADPRLDLLHLNAALISEPNP